MTSMPRPGRRSPGSARCCRRAGLACSDVALVTVYLTDMADLPRMNTIFKETFPTDPPARVTIQVQPQAKERIRIGLIAAR